MFSKVSQSLALVNSVSTLLNKGGIACRRPTASQDFCASAKQTQTLTATLLQPCTSRHERKRGSAVTAAGKASEQHALLHGCSQASSSAWRAAGQVAGYARQASQLRRPQLSHGRAPRGQHVGARSLCPAGLCSSDGTASAGTERSWISVAEVKDRGEGRNPSLRAVYHFVAHCWSSRGQSLCQNMTQLGFR